MYKNLPKYKKELLNLAKGVIKHLLNPPHSYKVVEIRGEFLDVHPLQWLKTASSMIVELSPALKRRKYSEGIKYVNELESVLKEIKSHGSVKQFQDKSKKTYNNFLKITMGLLNTYPEIYFKYLYLGDIHFSQNNYKEAIIYYKKIYDNYLNYGSHLAVVQCIIMLGRYERAYDEMLIMMKKQTDKETDASDSISLFHLNECIAIVEAQLIKKPRDTKLLLLRAFLILHNVGNPPNNQKQYINIYTDMAYVIKREKHNILARIFQIQTHSSYSMSKYKKPLISDDLGPWKKTFMVIAREGQALITDLVKILSDHLSEAENKKILQGKYELEPIYEHIKLLQNAADDMVLRFMQLTVFENKTWFLETQKMKFLFLNSGCSFIKKPYYSLRKRGYIYLREEKFKKAYEDFLSAQKILKTSPWVEAPEPMLLPLTYALIGLNKKKQALRLISKMQESIRENNFDGRTYFESDGCDILPQLYSDFIAHFPPETQLKKMESWFYEAVLKTDPKINSTSFYIKLCTLHLRENNYSKFLKSLKILLKLDEMVLKENAEFTSLIYEHIKLLPATNLFHLLSLLNAYQSAKNALDENFCKVFGRHVDELNINELKKNVSTYSYYVDSSNTDDEGKKKDPEILLEIDKPELFRAKSKQAFIISQIFMLRISDIDIGIDKEYDQKSLALKDIRTGVISTISSIIGEQVKLLEEKSKVIDIEQKSKLKIEKMIQQYTHTLSNYLFPENIREVARKLKKSKEFKDEALTLDSVFHAEVMIKRQGQLLQARQSGNSKEYQRFMRADRLPVNTKKMNTDIRTILNNSIARVITRFLNEDDPKFSDLRNDILKEKGVKLKGLRKDYEEKVFFSSKVKPLAWGNAHIGKVNMKLSVEWKQIRLLKDGHAESILQGHFSELFVNALKYMDHSQDRWLDIEFYEKTIKNTPYLITEWKNPFVKGKNISISTGKGLSGIENDVKMLNGLNGNPDFDECFKVNSDKDFEITMMLKRDLLIVNPELIIDLDKFYPGKTPLKN